MTDELSEDSTKRSLIIGGSDGSLEPARSRLMSRSAAAMAATSAARLFHPGGLVAIGEVDLCASAPALCGDVADASVFA
jgi:hypothetical protein